MARTRYAPDRGLTVRMTATMFLLGLVFVAFVAIIVGILSAIGASAGAIVFFALVLGGGMAFTSLFYSDKIALAAAGARVVSPEQAPELHGIVDRLCAMADMDKPAVAIAPTDLPNAFATGRNSKHAVLCVTNGLMRRLDSAELEGVLAHEMSHVAHKDVQVMTYASLLAIIAGLLVRFAFYGELFGGGRGRGNQNMAFIFLAMMVVSVVVYTVSFLLIRMLSRYRELAADRSGALLTGQPSALKSALVKVSGEMARIPTRDLRAAEPLNAFFFAPALAVRRGQRNPQAIFSTHPPREKRLKKLEKTSPQPSKKPCSGQRDKRPAGTGEVDAAPAPAPPAGAAAPPPAEASRSIRAPACPAAHRPPERAQSRTAAGCACDPRSANRTATATWCGACRGGPAGRGSPDLPRRVAGARQRWRPGPARRPAPPRRRCRRRRACRPRGRSPRRRRRLPARSADIPRRPAGKPRGVPRRNFPAPVSSPRPPRV